MALPGSRDYLPQVPGLWRLRSMWYGCCMSPIVVSYGGGVNSTALLVKAAGKCVRPDVIVFSDTGDERPSTYAYLDTFSRWLVSRDFPPIDVVRWVRKDGSFQALSDWCVEHKTLPSKAFGYSGCTSKWKQQPLDQFVLHHPVVQAAWARGEVVERWIGYDADEPARSERLVAKSPDPSRWRWRTPLVEWGMGRAECFRAIASAGLPIPSKSSCFFCPSMRKPEIDALGREHPGLLQRALDMEAGAVLTSPAMKGLGRTFAWRDYTGGTPTAGEVIEPACGCYDGDDAP